MKRAATDFKKDEWPKVKEYLEKHPDLSLYDLLKKAVLEKIERDNGGPLDRFQ